MAKSKAKYIIITLLIIVCLILLLLYLKDNQQDKSPTTISGPKPAFNYLPVSSNQQIVKHSNFTLAYSETDEQAAWVAYELTQAEVQGGTARSDDFREDSLITTGSASPDDYRRSGYDRGHLAPAGDMGFSEQAMSESFYMSNISPQEPAFNRGVWKDLEEDVRKWAMRDSNLYVVTGPVFGRSRKKIGENQVTVPTHFYKVILYYDGTEGKTIAFLMPNKATKKPVRSFAVSVDEVEQQTGIDFFPALPDHLEDHLEATVQLNNWID